MRSSYSGLRGDEDLVRASTFPDAGGICRFGPDDPLLAIASRTVSMNEQLQNPAWANEWIVKLAVRPLSAKPSAAGKVLVERALKDAGIPALPIRVGMVDGRGRDSMAMRRTIEEFLEEQL
jgi:benzoyl-CoA reductase subunit B